jgi:DivIVA domain-containing protein
MTDDDLLPLSDEHESSGFDVVLRGYDRRQVDDYVGRVEVAITDADNRTADALGRATTLEQQAADLQLRLASAERLAEGLPDPASTIGERLTQMLRLAEQEAEEIVGLAQERALASLADRTSALDRREADTAGAAAEADQLRLDAQRDAETLRSKAQSDSAAMTAEARRTADEVMAQARAQAQELVASATEQAERKKQTAEEDVAILHEDSRRDIAELNAAAQQEVEQLARQRDAIAAQLQQLRETLSAAVGPLHPQPPAT